MKIKAILTGATGMVGEGVLHECLLSNEVEEVLVIGRRACGIDHPKLKEIIVSNFYDLSPIESHLKGYNACFFCLGKSSMGMNEADYTKVTYTLTMSVATTLSKLNQDMVFCYVSGASTDSTEKGRMMWARVKGKTENDLMKLAFKRVYNFRPGYMHPTPGLKNVPGWASYITWLYPLFKIIMPNSVGTLKDTGLAMINAATKGYDKQILEVPDIKKLARA